MSHCKWWRIYILYFLKKNLINKNRNYILQELIQTLQSRLSRTNCQKPSLPHGYFIGKSLDEQHSSIPPDKTRRAVYTGSNYSHSLRNTFVRTKFGSDSLFPRTATLWYQINAILFWKNKVVKEKQKFRSSMVVSLANIIRAKSVSCTSSLWCHSDKKDHISCSSISMKPHSSYLISSLILLSFLVIRTHIISLFM